MTGLVGPVLVVFNGLANIRTSANGILMLRPSSRLENIVVSITMRWNVMAETLLVISMKYTSIHSVTDIVAIPTDSISRLMPLLPMSTQQRSPSVTIPSSQQTSARP
jgi:hypothetical protein